MEYAKIIFQNGFELTVNEETMFSGIRKIPNNLKYPQPGLNDMHEHQFLYLSSIEQGLEIHYHSSAGFIPSITDILMNYDFFSISDYAEEIYSTHAVFKVINV